MSGYDPEPTNDTYVIWTIGELVEAATNPEGVPPRISTDWATLTLWELEDIVGLTA